MKRHVVILGAGISGLSAAWYLKQQHGNDIDITLLERSSRTGGWIHTVEQDGFLFELGPRSIRARGTGVEVMNLIEDLGLKAEVIAADASAQTRYILRDKKLVRVPGGITSLLTSSLTRSVVPHLLKEFCVSANEASDESVDSFFRRRLGDHAADFLIDPLVSGIFAGDSRKLSMRCCFPKLYDMEKKQGSLTKGMLKAIFAHKRKGPRIVSLRSGMETLTRTLKQRVEAEIRFHCEIKKIVCEPHGVTLFLTNGTQLSADHVFSAIPANEIARLCGLKSDLHHTSVAVVNMGYRKNVLRKRGFGYLIPSMEQEDVLGVVFDSCVFPQQNRQADETRLTVMIGEKALKNADDQHIRSLALDAVERHLGIDALPDTVVTTLARQSIPQYPVAYKDQLRPSFPSLTLLGMGFHGVSVGDCVSSARSATMGEVSHG